MKEEIEKLLESVIQGHRKLAMLQSDLERARKTCHDIKAMNDDRIKAIQEENRKADSEFEMAQARFNSERSKVEESIEDMRRKLLKRIVMCNLKNLFKTLEAPKPPEEFLTRIHAGRFAIVYDEITMGSKPVNMYEWVVRVALSEEIKLREFLEKVWPTYREIHWGYGGEEARFYQRDFPSEKKAIEFARRNRAKICRNLIGEIKRLEETVDVANESVDEVFDFRLITDPMFKTPYARGLSFRVESAQKHRLILSPELGTGETRPYKITIEQEGYLLKISGHRLPSEARELKYSINRYFTTEFEAVDTETKQKIPNPRW